MAGVLLPDPAEVVLPCLEAVRQGIDLYFQRLDFRRPLAQPLADAVRQPLEQREQIGLDRGALGEREQVAVVLGIDRAQGDRVAVPKPADRGEQKHAHSGAVTHLARQPLVDPLCVLLAHLPQKLDQTPPGEDAEAARLFEPADEDLGETIEFRVVRLVGEVRHGHDDAAVRTGPDPTLPAVFC